MWLAAPPPLLAQRADTLFVAKASEDSAVDLEAIAIFGAGHFDSLPSGGEDSASEQFRRLVYAPGHRYWLFAGGARIGELRATGPGKPGCTGLPGSGRPSVRLPSGWQGLAATDSTARFRGTRRSPSVADLAILHRNARTLLIEAGAPARVADTAQLVDGWTFEVPASGVRWLVGSLRGETTAASGETSVHAAFLLIEIDRNGPHVALSWKHGGGEEDAEMRFPVDIFDFDRDGHPELITMTSYYESRDYQVWRRAADGWALWVITGGAGC
jgi:hypothetical protein